MSHTPFNPPYTGYFWHHHRHHHHHHHHHDDDDHHHHHHNHHHISITIIVTHNHPQRRLSPYHRVRTASCHHHFPSPFWRSCVISSYQHVILSYHISLSPRWASLTAYVSVVILALLLGGRLSPPAVLVDACRLRFMDQTGEYRELGAGAKGTVKNVARGGECFWASWQASS